MTTTSRIAEVADRSGSTPATLRYDEDIGLLAPTSRTEAGHRLYDLDLSIDARGVALEVRAPAEAAELVTALFGAPA